MMKLYVGNLPYRFSDEDLQSLFSPFGEVVTAIVVMDRQTGRSRGFGFVEFAKREQAEAAMKSLNGNQHGGRTLVVNEAKTPEKRRDGGPQR